MKVRGIRENRQIRSLAPCYGVQPSVETVNARDVPDNLEQSDNRQVLRSHHCIDAGLA